MNKIILLCILCISQAGIANTQAQNFSREVILDEQTDLTLSAVQLGASVYANSADNFKDLRLVNQDSMETPFLIQKISTAKSIPFVKRLAVPGKITELQKSTSEGFEIILSVPKDAPDVDVLTIDTAQKNFEYALDVLGSDDAEHWQKLVEGGIIYDYSKFMDFNNRDIELPKNHYRFFKVVVTKTTMTQHGALSQLTTTLKGNKEQERQETITLRHEPLHIEQIKLWHKQVERIAHTDQSFQYSLTDFTVQQDKQNKTTVIDINGELLPLKHITLDISTKNFSRKADLLVLLQHGKQADERVIASSRLEALHFKDFHRKQLTLNFPNQRQQKYRIVIYNQDNPPLQIDAITASGPGYQLLFLAQPKQHYKLLYGSNSAEKPRYDIAPIQELIQRGFKTTQLNLGEEKKQAQTIEDISYDFGKLLNSNVFLGFMISLMVIVLGWSLYRVSRQIGKLDEPPE